jgi:hypothetical protein
MTTRPDRSRHPNRPYSTGELAELLGLSTPTVIRMVERGHFGRKGRDWWWTDPGAERGDRRVRAGAVRDYLQRRS